ncbi:hypothetical protein C8Q74DRAFT_1446562, partial [Fomes fomentarius]
MGLDGIRMRPWVSAEADPAWVRGGGAYRSGTLHRVLLVHTRSPLPAPGSSAWTAAWASRLCASVEMSSVLDSAFQELTQLRVSVYANVASLALLLFDWQLTLGDEINMVWMSKAKLSKILFIWIRYFGIASHIFGTSVYLIDNPLPAVCNVANRLQTAAPNVVWWSVEFVFALRVWILYRRSRKLLIFFAFMYIASIIISIVVLVKALVRVTPVSIPQGLGVTGCFSIVSGTVYEAIVL